MRIRFDDLPAAQRPRSQSAHFSEAWQIDSVDREFCNAGIERWRRQRRDAPVAS
jgi:hypothetical protein